METVLQLPEGNFKGKASVYTINEPDVKAENTFATPGKVKTKETTTTANSRNLNYTFEPHSVTALVCDIS